MSLYLPILRTAFRIALHERRLWLFALFAGLLIGSGFGSAVIQTFDVDPTQRVLASALNFQTASPGRLGALWEQARATGLGATLALSAYGLLLLALVAIIVWLAVIGVNAIIITASRAARAQAIPTNLRQQANACFWPTFGIHILTKVAEAVLLAAWMTVLTASAVRDTPLMGVRAIVAFVVTALLLAIVHTVTPYAVASAVLDRRDWFTALREAFALLRDHWFIAIEASLCFTAAHFVAIAVWLVGSALLALPFLFLGGTAIASGAGSLVPIVLIGGIAMLVIWLACVTIAFTSFLVSAWTLLFLRLTSTGERPQPWVLRKFGRSAV